jgi:hypothetical protein
MAGPLALCWALTALHAMRAPPSFTRKIIPRAGAAMSVRTLTPLDRLLAQCERALEAVAGSPAAHRPSPGRAVPESDMVDADRRHAAGLMRINHTGEVCAQALYLGQAALARHADTRDHLLHAADEETDHLAWCAARLKELDSRPSLLNPLWYAGSFSRWSCRCASTWRSVSTTKPRLSGSPASAAMAPIA